MMSKTVKPLSKLPEKNPAKLPEKGLAKQPEKLPEQPVQNKLKVTIKHAILTRDGKIDPFVCVENG